jgi:NTE family protein
MTSSVASDPLLDDLAVPISFEARHGDGVDRAIVLGGGGLFFVAWQISYLHGLARREVDLGRAELVVGTSAGSIVASILTSGRLSRFATKVDLLSKAPFLVAALAGSGTLRPSQERARDAFAAATDAEPDTVRAIGHAALAAQATPSSQTQRSIGFVMGVRRWSSEALRISTVDTYTGERLVLRADHGLSLPRAAAASAAVPGLFSPCQIGDRRCMDGGVSGSGLHSDLVAGASRAIVVSLVGGETSHPGGMTSAPNGQLVELDHLRASGTQVHVAGPSGVTPEQLMDPTEMARALELGEQQAERDARAVAQLWA